MIQDYTIKETSQITDISKAAKILFDIDNSSIEIIYENELKEPFTSLNVQLTEGILEDTSLQNWSNDKCYLQGSKYFLWKYISNPIYDINLIQTRQKEIINMIKRRQVIENNLEEARNYENDVLWLFNIRTELSKTWPLNLLYPTGFLMKYINYNALILDSFHLYKCVLSPVSNAASPVLTLFGPLIYLRKSMKINLSMKSYFNFISLMFKEFMKIVISDFRNQFSKILSIVAYLIMYVYSIIQGFQYAFTLYKIRKTVCEKINSISKFVATFKNLYVDTDSQELLEIPNTTNSIYNLLTYPDLKMKLKYILQQVYELDAKFVATKLLLTKKYSMAKFVTDRPTQIFGMGHLLLDNKRQVTNPCSLQKNLIITGPNAAGKTTYTKALLTNMILAQTFGITRAKTSFINPINAIGSFMRISDVVGTNSLFEAEVKRCSEIIKQAEGISNAGQTALYFLDEPMHSTPPTEGTATSFAVLEHLGKLPGIRVILTTHYHTLRNLEYESPNYFKNICMEAIPYQNGFLFPYRIKSGPSLQCIALELLKENELSSEVVKRAIEIKNKICKGDINAF